MTLAQLSQYSRLSLGLFGLIITSVTQGEASKYTDALAHVRVFGYNNVWPSEEGWFVSKDWVFANVTTIDACAVKCRVQGAPSGSYGYAGDPTTCYCDQENKCLEPYIISRGGIIFSSSPKPGFCAKGYCDVYASESTTYCSGNLDLRTPSPTISPTPLPQPTFRPTTLLTALPTRSPTIKPSLLPTGNLFISPSNSLYPTGTNNITGAPIVGPTTPPKTSSPSASPTIRHLPTATSVVDLSPFVILLKTDKPGDLSSDEERRLAYYTANHLQAFYRNNLNLKGHLFVALEVLTSQVGRGASRFLRKRYNGERRELQVVRTITRKLGGNVTFVDVPSNGNDSGVSSIPTTNQLASLTVAAFRGVPDTVFLKSLDKDEQQYLQVNGEGKNGVLANVLGASVQVENVTGSAIEGHPGQIQSSQLIKQGREYSSWLGLSKRTWIIIGCVCGAFVGGLIFGFGILICIKCGYCSQCCTSKSDTSFPHPQSKMEGGVMKIDLNDPDAKFPTPKCIARRDNWERSTNDESVSPDRSLDRFDDKNIASFGSLESSTELKPATRQVSFANSGLPHGSKSSEHSPQKTHTFDEMQDVLYDIVDDGASDGGDGKWISPSVSQDKSDSSLDKVIAKALGDELNGGRLSTVKEIDVVSFADFSEMNEEQFNKVLQFDIHTGKPIEMSRFPDSEVSVQKSAPGKSEAKNGPSNHFESVWNGGAEIFSASAKNKNGKKAKEELKITEDDSQSGHQDAPVREIDLTSPRRLCDRSPSRKDDGNEYVDSSSRQLERVDSFNDNQSLSTIGMCSAYAAERHRQVTQIEDDRQNDSAEKIAILKGESPNTGSSERNHTLQIKAGLPPRTPSKTKLEIATDKAAAEPAIVANLPDGKISQPEKTSEQKKWLVSTEAIGKAGTTITEQQEEGIVSPPKLNRAAQQATSPTTANDGKEDSAWNSPEESLFRCQSKLIPKDTQVSAQSKNDNFEVQIFADDGTFEADDETTEAESRTGWDDCNSAFASGQFDVSQRQSPASAVTADYDDVSAFGFTALVEGKRKDIKKGNAYHNRALHSKIGQDVAPSTWDHESSLSLADDKSAATSYFAMQKQNYVKASSAQSEESGSC